MKKFFLKALDCEPEELSPVVLLLTISFFIGVFIVMFDVTTSTLFLDDRNLGREKLPWAIVISGVIGAIVAFVFVTLQNRISFNKLVTATFILCFIVAASLSTLLENYRSIAGNSIYTAWQTHQGAITEKYEEIPNPNPHIKSTCKAGIEPLSDDEIKRLSDGLAKKLDVEPFGVELIFSRIKFISFACLGTLNILAVLSFYGIVSRAFNIKNQKRLTGSVDQGGMFATAIAFFLVPVMDTFDFFQDVVHYLFLSCGGIMVSLILFIVFISKFKTDDLVKVKKFKGKRENVADVGTMTKTPYVRLLALIFFISAVAATFVDFSFLSMTSQKFTDPKDLASFFGYYGFILTIFSLLLQIFFGDKIIGDYGLKVALLILPAILIVFTTIGSLLGSIPMDKELQAMVLLLLIALCKFFFQSARETFEEPIFKINFFLPFDKKIRHDVEAKISGVFLQISVFVAGALLIGFGAIDVKYVFYFMIIIFFGYGYVVLKLHKEYQETLKNTLATQKGEGAVNAKTAFSVAQTLQDELKTDNQDRMIYSLKLMEKIEPVMLESALLNYSGNRNPEIRKYVLERINELKPHSALNSVKKITETESSPVIKQLANNALQYLKDTENIPLSGPKLTQLVKSRKKEERENAAKALSRSNGDDESTLHLVLLMRDVDPKVRMSAIISAGKSGNEELWPILIEQLSSSLFGSAAAGVLESFGEKIMPALEAAFHKSGQTEQTQLRIIQIYGRIGGKKAIELLWAKTDYPNKKVRGQIFLSLSNCDFKVDADKTAKIKQSLETAIGNAAWNLAALSEIAEDETQGPIREALKEEYKHDMDLIFLILSFIYDSQSIRLVKENIESGTVEGIVYGMELLDVFLQDDIQSVLFPLIDDISQEERTEKLQTHFPRESLDSTQVLIQIINRDYNYVNRWTKACAVFCLSVTPGYTVTDDLIANLFNADPLLRETSAWVIHYLDKKIYHDTTQRLSVGIKKELDEKITNSTWQEELRIERVIKLKQTKGFSQVPGIILADLEEIIEVEEYKKGQTLISKDEDGNCPLFIVAEGSVGLFENNTLVASIKEKEIIGEKLILESDINNYSVVATENTRVYRIEKNKFFELMSNNYELAKEFINGIASEKVKSEENMEEVNS